MPTYRYICPYCRMAQDAYRKINERDNCPVCDCGATTERRITAAMVSVFQPYTTVAYDKEAGKPLHIKSQGEHRAFLQRNGYEEVGNDQSMAPLPQEEVAHRRRQKLKAQQQDPDFAFNPDTQEAAA